MQEWHGGGGGGGAQSGAGRRAWWGPGGARACESAPKRRVESGENAAQLRDCAVLTKVKKAQLGSACGPTSCRACIATDASRLPTLVHTEASCVDILQVHIGIQAHKHMLVFRWCCVAELDGFIHGRVLILLGWYNPSWWQNGTSIAFLQRLDARHPADNGRTWSSAMMAGTASSSGGGGSGTAGSIRSTAATACAAFACATPGLAQLQLE